MSDQNQNLEKAIISTVVFFDIFDYPLTLVEIHKWLYKADKKYQLYDIIEILKSENLKIKIFSESGFYFLVGRKDLIQTRLERYQLAEKKFKIALKAAAWIRWLTFVKMIAVCNNAGYNNASAKSDIDFFIVVKEGRLWFSRAIITLVVSLLGVRRHNKKITNRVCLSFYISSRNLDLSNIVLKPTDPYFIFWLATLAPIYNQGEYQKFLQSNRSLLNCLPNFYHTVLNNRRFVHIRSWDRFFRKIVTFILPDFIADKLERLSKLVQMKKMKRNSRSSPDQTGTNVIVSDLMLKFHENDKREEYYQMWRQKLETLI